MDTEARLVSFRSLLFLVFIRLPRIALARFSFCLRNRVIGDIIETVRAREVFQNFQNALLNYVSIFAQEMYPYYMYVFIAIDYSRTETSIDRSVDLRCYQSMDHRIRDHEFLRL